MVGHASEWKKEGHEIRPGFHRIEIRHPGYYSFFQEIELPPAPKPSSAPTYKKSSIDAVVTRPGRSWDSMKALTRLISVAGNPPQRACSRMISGPFAR